MKRIINDLEQVDESSFQDSDNSYCLNEKGELTHLNITSSNIEFELIFKEINLQELFLSSNSISEIPQSISSLTNLQTLFLSSNSISEIPQSISSLTNLQELYLESNNISEIPQSISSLTNLQRLDLGSNSISEIPQSISSLTNLQTLYLESNNISEIPQSISSLTNLQRLFLSSNSISEIPQSISSLTNLQRLDLGSNSISEIPQSISSLTNLQTLFLSSNSISEIPQSISSLTNLQELYLESNNISEIPQSISSLTNLQTLFLSSNSISEIPQSISSLTNLQRLFLSSNSISEIPQSISSLTNLQTLYLRNNEFKIQIEIFEKEPQEIISHILKIQNSVKKKLNEAKILVVGDERVGKTSVINRLCKKEYQMNQSTTIGIDISKNYESVDDDSIRLNYWDFAGQELTHSTHQFFLTKRSLYLLVIDAQKEDNNRSISYWLKMIKLFGQDSPIIVVVNKTDKNSGYKFDEYKYSKDYDIQDIIYVSSEKNEQIDTLKNSIMNTIFTLPHISDLLTLEWFNIKKDLEKFEEQDIEFIPTEEFTSICHKHGEKDIKSQNNLLELLHDLGTIVSFHGDLRLRETKIINPVWITNAVYNILRSEVLKTNNGELEINDLSKILDIERYPSRHHIWIIDLMRKFDLCFNMGKDMENKYLVPFTLNDNQPNINFDEYKDGLNFRYEYSFLPKNLISKVIVKAEQYNKKHNYWKNGMCLEYENGVESIIISDDDKSIIDVKLKGSSHQNREFLGIIKHLFREVHGTSFSPSEMVPLTKDIHDGQFYPYQDLLSLEQDSLKENAFGSPPKKYTVSELLNGYRLDIDIGKKEYTKNEIHHHYGNEFHGNIKINNYYSEVKNAFEEFKTIPSSSQQEKELIEDIENSIGTLDKAPDKKSAIKYIKDKIEKFDGIRKQVDGYTEKYDKAATTIGNLINKLDGFWDIVDKI